MRWIPLFLVLLGSPPSPAREPHPSILPIEAREHLDWVFEVQPPPPPLPPPPDRFEILNASGRPCRIPPQRLPWRIYSGPPATQRMLDRAIETWNRLGLDLGLGYLYQRCDEPDSADLHIRWSDPQLPRDKAAATWWSAGESQRRVLGLSMDGKFAIPEGNQAQILTHELGHVLGLGESYQPGDMMYYIMERRHLRLDQVQLSMRDKLALRWLYQQQNFIPIRGRRD